MENIKSGINCVLIDGGRIRTGKDVVLKQKIPPGAYTLHYNPNSGEKWLQPLHFNSDAIIDLPSAEYSMVVNQIEKFLEEDTKKAFKDYGYLYKRSALLYGKPGTGKTTIVDRVAARVIEMGGVVFFNPHPQLLPMFFQDIEELQNDTMTMCIFEEIDELLMQYESQLLNILDGEIQKDNVIYLATTNNIDKIPDRIRRPGRFSTVVEVGLPNTEARFKYISTKIKNVDETNQLTDKTKGMTIDEIKEVVLATRCLGEDVDEICKRIRNNKERLSAIEIDEHKASQRGRSDESYFFG